MMGFVQVAVFVLGLLSVGHSAPVTNCETLTQQIDIPEIDQLLGRWIYQADVTTLPGSKQLTKLLVKNTWANITKGTEDNAINIYQTQRTVGRCFSMGVNYTVENNTLFTSHPFTTTQTLLKTSCPDCMVLLAKFRVTGNDHRGLQLISRRSTLTTAELEEFKKQAECLNLPDPVFFDTETDLCTEESVTQDTGGDITDLTSFVTSETVSEAFKLLDKLSNNEAKMRKFAKLLASGVIPEN